MRTLRSFVSFTTLIETHASGLHTLSTFPQFRVDYKYLTISRHCFLYSRDFVNGMHPRIGSKCVIYETAPAGDRATVTVNIMLIL